MKIHLFLMSFHWRFHLGYLEFAVLTVSYGLREKFHVRFEKFLRIFCFWEYLKCFSFAISFKILDHYSIKKRWKLCKHSSPCLPAAKKSKILRPNCESSSHKYIEKTSICINISILKVSIFLVHSWFVTMKLERQGADFR